MIAAPRKRIILQDGEQVKSDRPAGDDEGFSPAAKIEDRPKVAMKVLLTVGKYPGSTSTSDGRPMPQSG
jgi:hypothetical protein